MPGAAQIGPWCIALAAILVHSLTGANKLQFQPKSAETQGSPERLADRYVVDTAYFHTIGASILDGRDIQDTDSSDTAPVVVVNHTLASLCWPHGSPIGKQLQISNMGNVPYTIIGVVRDIDHFALNQRHKAEIYVPFNAR